MLMTVPDTEGDWVLVTTSFTISTVTISINIISASIIFIFFF